MTEHRGEPLGLRARKKIAAMERIQDAALDLFEARGFDAVTIEAVAEAAEVSPRTVYRYFGTKEMLVIWDEFDEVELSPLVDAFASSDPIDGLRQGLHLGFVNLEGEQLRRSKRRLRLVYGVPAVEATLALHAAAFSRRIAAHVAPVHGELRSHVLVHALVAGILGAMRHWTLNDFKESPIDLLDQALDVLQHGTGTPPDESERHE
ncbi:TetR family transcriptional regulator [Glycomyces sp. NRRL B-16210]|uniref:TetR family transcriptional regulator n=1 Tax=Glycomyces sp. NRRL B-16210 TaxID=1463821 RepID=UPI00068F04E7|nr:TetR family transcriptional regulator [Glycomyces sp. NRRL B-16210]